MSIAKIMSPPLSQTIQEAQNALAGKLEKSDGTAKAKADADKVGRDFEAILVRQMLSKANIAGKGGYSDMAIEGLATSITSAGGLGLGKVISEQLQAHDHAVKVSESNAKEAAAKK